MHDYDAPLTMAVLIERAEDAADDWINDHASEITADGHPLWDEWARDAVDIHVPMHYATKLQVLASDPSLWSEQLDCSVATLDDVFNCVVRDRLIEAMYTRFNNAIIEREEERMADLDDDGEGEGADEDEGEPMVGGVPLGWWYGDGDEGADARFHARITDGDIDGVQRDIVRAMDGLPPAEWE